MKAATTPTILAIDDSLEARMLLRKVIARKRDDARVLVVDTGVEGIEAATFYLPTVIICDLGLPDMDGRDVIRALRADPITKAIPIVVVTGDDSPRTRKEVGDLGANDFIAKPYDIHDLADRVLVACV